MKSVHMTLVVDILFSVSQNDDIWYKLRPGNKGKTKLEFDRLRMLMLALFLARPSHCPVFASELDGGKALN